jgi:hypothetical protein
MRHATRSAFTQEGTGGLWFSPTVWLAALAIIVLASCERTPSKSDYVSARVSVLCEGQSSDALRACRIAVIKQFSDTPLEEMQRRFPKPEPRSRPSCGD